MVEGEVYALFQEDQGDRQDAPSRRHDKEWLQRLGERDRVRRQRLAAVGCTTASGSRSTSPTTPCTSSACPNPCGAGSTGTCTPLLVLSENAQLSATPASLKQHCLTLVLQFPPNTTSD
jgi:hypothetical protein